jgi:tetratricopeptide (TPR) repeat protein
MFRFATGDSAGVADVERGLELALEHTALSAARRGYVNLAAVMAVRGNEDRREQLLAEAELLARRLGDSWSIRLINAYRLSAIFFWRGAWDEALQIADEFIAECEGGAPHHAEGLAQAIRATIRFARDDVAGALEDSERALEHARGAHTETAWVALVCSAAISLELGRLDEAQTLIDELLVLDPGVVTTTASIVATVAAELGRGGEIEAAFAHLPPDSPWHKSVGLILDGRFDRAADLFAKIGAVAPEAHARLRAGAALAKRKRHAEAKEQLEKALAFYRSVRATRYIRQAEALLAAAREAPEVAAEAPR